MTKTGKPSGQRPVASADAVQADWVLCLYVNNMTPRSRLAIAHIRELCQEHLRVQHKLTIIDVCRQPQVAKDEQIVALPTLLRKWPLPEKRIIGDLSNHQKVLAALDLAVEVAQ